MRSSSRSCSMTPMSIQIVAVFLVSSVSALPSQHVSAIHWPRPSGLDPSETRRIAEDTAASSTAVTEMCVLQHTGPRQLSFAYDHYSCGGFRAMTLRGGADKTKSVKSKGPALGEAALLRLLGKQYSLDMKESANVQVLVKLIQQHRKGGGEFNAVTLNGAEFQIPGTKSDSNEDADSHFKELGKGQSTKKQLKDSASLDGLKKVVAVQTDYKGLEYTEAELAKMPKAEAEYRRELMQRSKQEMKMEMGFEGAMKGGMDMMKGVMSRFKKEEGAEADYTKKLPTKGILQFRFKEKETKASAKPAAAPKPVKQAEWAKGRAQALKRNQKEQEKDAPESFSDRLNRYFSVRFLFKKSVSVALRVVTVVLDILMAIKNAAFASRASEADVRKARSAAIAD